MPITQVAAFEPRVTRPLLPALTGLRYIAAVHVVLTHTAGVTRDWPWWISNVINTGYVGVTLFFVLSGFILVYNYVDSSNGGMRSTRRTFWTARLARVYPLYLVALLVAVPSLIATVYSGHVSVKDSILAVILTPLLLQAWSLTAALIWNAPAWSLSAEAFFYIAFPFLLGLMSNLRRRRILVAIAASWLAALAVALVQARFAPDLLWQELAIHLPLVRILEFIVGMLLGIAFVKYKWRVDGRWAPTIVAAVLVTLALSDGNLPRSVISNALMVPLFSLLILALSSNTGPLFSVLASRIAILLGEASFALYLLHLPLWRYYIRAVDHFMPYAAESVPGVLIFVILVTVVAIGGYKWVEVPARKYLKIRLSKPHSR